MFTLDELNLLNAALNSAAIKGSDAPFVTQVLQKLLKAREKMIYIGSGNFHVFYDLCWY